MPEQLLFQLGLDPDLSAVNKAVQKVGDILGRGSITAGGAVLGGAVGGPLGALAGGIAGNYLGRMMTNTGGGVGGLVGRVGIAGIGGVANALHSLEEPLGPIALGLNAMTTGLNELSRFVKTIPLVGGLLGPMTDALTMIPGLFKDITETLVGFAAKVSPATYRQFSLAVESVQATIGQAFVPVLELMRDAVGDVADMLANLLPNTTEVQDALGEFSAVLQTTMRELKAAMIEAGPSIRQGLIDGLKQLAHWGAVAVRVIGMLATRLKDYFGVQNVAAGITPEERLRTLPAQPANIQGIEEFERALQVAAYSQGTTGKSISQQQLDAMVDLGKIDAEAKAVLDTIDTTIGSVRQWWDTHWPEMKNTFGQIANSTMYIAQIIQWIANWLHGDSARQDKKGWVRVIEERVSESKRREHLNDELRKKGLNPNDSPTFGGLGIGNWVFG